LTKTSKTDDFNIDEIKILYALDKGSNYGENRSRDLQRLVMNRKISKKKMPEFIKIFKEKLHERDWSCVYRGSDGNEYVYLKAENIGIVKNFLRIKSPFLEMGDFRP